MRFRLRSLFLAAALVAVICALVRWSQLDGFGGAIFSLLLPDDTLWADGYSDDSFLAVRIGMERSEVYALLGKPLEVRPSPTMFEFDARRHNLGEVLECWTQTPNNSHFHVRQVVFKGDTVVHKSSGFYVD